MRQKRIGKCDAAVQLFVILFRHKVLCQFQPAAIWKDTVSILPDDAEFVVGDLAQHRFQFVPLLHGRSFSWTTSPPWHPGKHDCPSHAIRLWFTSGVPILGNSRESLFSLPDWLRR